MKLDLDNPTEEVRIEVIPLIDVIFCILTFFILAAVGLTRQQAISLDLPGADSSTPVPAAEGRERLYVSIDAAGQVYIDQSPVPVGILYDVVRQHQQIAPDGLIVLYAAKNARYEDVVTVLDLLRSVGGERVALATLPGDSNPLPGDSELGGTDTLPRGTGDLGDLLAPSPGVPGSPQTPEDLLNPGNSGLTSPGLTDPSLTNPSLTNPSLTPFPGTSPGAAPNPSPDQPAEEEGN